MYVCTKKLCLPENFLHNKMNVYQNKKKKTKKLLSRDLQFIKLQRIKMYSIELFYERDLIYATKHFVGIELHFICMTLTKLWCTFSAFEREINTNENRNKTKKKKKYKTND